MADEYITKAQAIEVAESLRPVAGDTITNAFIKGIEGVEGQQGWISVKDRLPEKNGTYLCCERHGSLNSCGIRSFAQNLEETGEYDFEGLNMAGWFDYDSEYGFYVVHTVTHWMPMPKPPKEE